MIGGMDNLFFLRDESETDIAMISAIKSENENIAYFEFKYRSVSRNHKTNYKTMSNLCDFFTSYIKEIKSKKLAHGNNDRPVALSRRIYLILARMIFPRYSYKFYSTFSCEDIQYEEFCTFHVVSEESNRKHLSIIYLRDEAIAVELLDDDSCMDFIEFFRRFNHAVES